MDYAPAGRGAVAVSYTHLDVYKRQTDTMRYLYELKIYIFDDSSITSYKTSVLGGYAISSGKIVKKIMKESKLCVLFPTASQSLYGKIMM